MPTLYLPNMGNGGRLGNHLFTIASTVGLALTHGFIPRFQHDWKYRHFFPNLPDNWFGPVKADSRSFMTVRERTYEYDAQIGEVLRNAATEGADVYLMNSYLQSPLYWQGHEDKIRYYLKPDGCQPGSRMAVAMHYRRGDYVGNPNYVNLPMKYYIERASLLHDWPLECASDDPDFLYLHHGTKAGTELDDFKRLTECNLHVCSNSTFAWWAAYLSGGVSFFPHEWFRGKLSLNASTATLRFRGSKWVPHDFGAADLTDTTFIIPVMIDHQDRIDNLRHVVGFIHEHFDTNIIIGEINTSKLPEADIRFDYNGKFHRTAALNAMTKMAKTKYVVNWDADVLVPPFQILHMVQALRNGADIVYPYDGQFCGVPRNHFEAVKKDFNYLAGKRWRGTADTGFKSVGGAVGYDKERFLKAGGENENFVSYAPEDQERYWRFNLLGMDVKRIDGPLFHLDHYRGPDSTMNNPDSRASHRYWDSIKNFDKQQIIEHLKLDWG